MPKKRIVLFTRRLLTVRTAPKYKALLDAGDTARKLQPFAGSAVTWGLSALGFTIAGAIGLLATYLPWLAGVFSVLTLLTTLVVVHNARAAVWADVAFMDAVSVEFTQLQVAATGAISITVTLRTHVPQLFEIDERATLGQVKLDGIVVAPDAETKQQVLSVGPTNEPVNVVFSISVSSDYYAPFATALKDKTYVLLSTNFRLCGIQRAINAHVKVDQ